MIGRASSSPATTRMLLMLRHRRPLLDKLSLSASSSRYLSSSPSPSDSSSLYLWGTNTKGSLAAMVPEKSIQWEPAKFEDKLPSDSPIQQVVCGPTDTAIVTSAGEVYVAGENKSGQLGLGHKNPVPNFTKLEQLEDPVEKVALGPSAGACITQGGDLYTFGFGGSLVAGMGLLGHGDGESYESPKLVTSLVEDGVYAQDVTLGESHMTVLTTEGEVLTTGSSSYGRLGNGETSVDSLYLEPTEILQNVQAIAGGKSFTLALQDGVIYGFGRNHKGQLGTGFGMAVDMYAMEQVPQPIDSDELINRTVTKIAAGANHAACITESGECFLWGMSLHLEPIRMAELLHTKIVDIQCGNDYTLALSEDAQLYVWGKGKTGVLGKGSSVKNLNQPKLLQTLDGVTQISAGWAHAGCLASSSTVLEGKSS